jgi:hypothetical protein
MPSGSPGSSTTSRCSRAVAGAGGHAVVERVLQDAAVAPARAGGDAGALDHGDGRAALGEERRGAAADDPRTDDVTSIGACVSAADDLHATEAALVKTRTSCACRTRTCDTPVARRREVSHDPWHTRVQCASR